MLLEGLHVNALDALPLSLLHQHLVLRTMLPYLDGGIPCLCPSYKYTWCWEHSAFRGRDVLPLSLRQEHLVLGALCLYIE